MKDLEPTDSSLAGQLLVSHPGLDDPNFKKTVILVSAHSPDEGTLGVVINRPTGATLGEIRKEYAVSPLKDVPIYAGGPVNPEQVILAAWRWVADEGVFRLYFGISPDKAESMLFGEPELVMRGFVGYSGWSGGQLEGELEQNAWVVTTIDGALLERYEGTRMWRSFLSAQGPEMAFLAEIPDDPSLN